MNRFSWRRLPWTVEVLSIGIGYALYSVIRVVSPHRLPESLEHASDVIGIERAFGLFHELGANEFLTHHYDLGIASAYYYATLHFIVTPLVLAWVWRRRSYAYGQLRSALVIATAIALVVYATWPLAPPRFALPGAEDTVLVHPVFWASGHGVEGFINDLAAMPSLHVGWALWCAAAVVVSFRSAWRHLAWLYPLATTVVVVATANHYLVDAIGGAAVVLVPLYLCGLRPPGVLVGAELPDRAPAVVSPRTIETSELADEDSISA
ncbi:MAG: hypothetical protein JWO12_1941 [Frankiales bacterium]|nr:hypothetical protein [Frankiales bacterium]